MNNLDDIKININKRGYGSTNHILDNLVMWGEIVDGEASKSFTVYIDLSNKKQLSRQLQEDIYNRSQDQIVNFIKENYIALISKVRDKKVDLTGHAKGKINSDNKLELEFSYWEDINDQ